MINEYLDKNFLDIINYQFTAQVEALLDEIATGSKIWHRVVDGVYMKLNPIIDQLACATSARKSIQDAGGDTANRKLLGNHPQTGLPVYAIKSRQGFLVCESNDADKTKSRFASFTGRFDSMSLEKAIELLIFPRTLGQYKLADVILKKAKNIYLAWNGKNYSIENYMKSNAVAADIEPETTSLEEAIAILQYYETQDIQRIANASQDRKLNDDITIKKGPFGAYIKYKGERNIRLPKVLKERWETITLEECLPVVEKEASKPVRTSSARGANRRGGRGGSTRGCGSAAARGRGRGAKKI
jgi:DNA topoisomerase-1